MGIAAFVCFSIVEREAQKMERIELAKEDEWKPRVDSDDKF
jgi:hypothetical protein